MSNKEIFIGIGLFVTGVIVGVIFMNNNYPYRYQGKTAAEWSTAYTTTQEKIDANKQAAQLPDPYQGLVSCLRNMQKYTDYSRGTAYYVNDVNDVTQCISEAQQQRSDNSTQILEQGQSNP